MEFLLSVNGRANEKLVGSIFLVASELQSDDISNGHVVIRCHNSIDPGIDRSVGTTREIYR